MADFDFARRLVSKRIKPFESEAPKRPGASKEDSQDYGKGKSNKSRERKSKNPASEGLWRAARKGELQQVEKKLTWMGGIEWQEPKSGWTALHAAVCNDTDPQDRVVQALLEHGASPNLVDENGATPLHSACMYGRETAARLLVKHGADVNATTKHGWTALHFAARDDDADIVRTLVRNDFIEINKATTKVYWGLPSRSTVLDAYSSPESKKNDEILELLLHHGAKPGDEKLKVKAKKEFGVMGEMKKYPPIWNTL